MAKQDCKGFVRLSVSSHSMTRREHWPDRLNKFRKALGLAERTKYRFTYSAVVTFHDDTMSGQVHQAILTAHPCKLLVHRSAWSINSIEYSERNHAISLSITNTRPLAEVAPFAYIDAEV